MMSYAHCWSRDSWCMAQMRWTVCKLKHGRVFATRQPCTGSARTCTRRCRHARYLPPHLPQFSPLVHSVSLPPSPSSPSRAPSLSRVRTQQVLLTSSTLSTSLDTKEAKIWSEMAWASRVVGVLPRPNCSVGTNHGHSTSRACAHLTSVQAQAASFTHTHMHTHTHMRAHTDTSAQA